MVWFCFLFAMLRYMSAQLSITQGKPQEPIPNLSEATYGSDSGIFRTFGWAACFIQSTEKEYPMPNVIERCATGQISGSALLIPAELRGPVLACALLMYCSSAFCSPPRRSGTHSSNPDKLKRGGCPHTHQGGSTPLPGTQVGRL